MKVVRRPLVLNAEPPNEDHPNDYLVKHRGMFWLVEKEVFLQLYELESVSLGKRE